jgi:Uma2 family endonuclease
MATVPAASRRSTLAPPANPVRISWRDDRFCLEVPQSAFTFAGFREWITSPEVPEKLRATFVEGEVIIDMSEEDPETHVGPKGEVFAALYNLNRELKLGKLYTDGLLISNEEAEVSNSPDASFLSFKSLRSGRVRLVPREGKAGQYREIEGTPDWVLEVISNSSVKKDTEKLRRSYHKAGIPEYWLIDARGEEIVFQILLWRKTGYVAASSRSGWQRSRVFGRSFRLQRQLDEFGLWEFTLHVKTG